MREIKFRIWDKKIKMFINAWSAGVRFELNTGNLHDNGTNVTEDYILMQYTGFGAVVVGSAYKNPELLEKDNGKEEKDNKSGS